MYVVYHPHLAYWCEKPETQNIARKGSILFTSSASDFNVVVDRHKEQTRSSVTSLTTFLGSVVVALLFSESYSFSVAELFYCPSSVVASTQATFFQTSLKLSAAALSAAVWNKWISQWCYRHTQPCVWSRQKHFRMTVTSQTNYWADAYNVSAAGEYR